MALHKAVEIMFLKVDARSSSKANFHNRNPKMSSKIQITGGLTESTNDILLYDYLDLSKILHKYPFMHLTRITTTNIFLALAMCQPLFLVLGM